jgi:hypothetical protein
MRSRTRQIAERVHWVFAFMLRFVDHGPTDGCGAEVQAQDLFHGGEDGSGCIPLSQELKQITIRVYPVV